VVRDVSKIAEDAFHWVHCRFNDHISYDLNPSEDIQQKYWSSWTELVVNFAEYTRHISMNMEKTLVLFYVTCSEISGKFTAPIVDPVSLYLTSFSATSSPILACASSVTAANMPCKYYIRQSLQLIYKRFIIWNRFPGKNIRGYPCKLNSISQSISNCFISPQHLPVKHYQTGSLLHNSNLVLWDHIPRKFCRRNMDGDGIGNFQQILKAWPPVLHFQDWVFSYHNTETSIPKASERIENLRATLAHILLCPVSCLWLQQNAWQTFIHIWLCARVLFSGISRISIIHSAITNSANRPGIWERSIEYWYFRHLGIIKVTWICPYAETPYRKQLRDFLKKILPELSTASYTDYGEYVQASHQALSGTRLPYSIQYRCTVSMNIAWHSHEYLQAKELYLAFIKCNIFSISKYLS